MGFVRVGATAVDMCVCMARGMADGSSRHALVRHQGGVWGGGGGRVSVPGSYTGGAGILRHMYL